MKAICYKNTLTSLPNWNPNDKVHLSQSLGFAYEDEKHFIHFYGWDSGFKGISTGLTVVEGKMNETTAGKSLESWVIKNFGAKDIKTVNTAVGHSVKSVWRPGLYYDTDVIQAIGTTEHERFLSQQSIRVLINKLDEIFFFVEPNNFTKETFGHKIRELLILTCTEIENFWNAFLVQGNMETKANGFSTKDYVKLKEKLFLADFEFNLISYPELGVIIPFADWNLSNPSKSLFWYDAYNKTKHDRTANFSKATLWNTINAVVACLILYCVRFGPFTMFESNNHFSSLIKQHFSGQISKDCKETFYVPQIDTSEISRIDKIVIDSSRDGIMKNYVIGDLVL